MIHGHGHPRSASYQARSILLKAGAASNGMCGGARLVERHVAVAVRRSGPDEDGTDSTTA